MTTWRCFHCDEVFRDRASAALHFGPSETCKPACQIDIVEYRRMEEVHRRHCDEDTELHREIAKLQADAHTAIRRANEEGYAHGLRDGATHARAS